MLGGIVVYTKLNPYVVMVHFFATMLLLVDAVVLVHRSTRDYTPGLGPPPGAPAAHPALLRRAGAARRRDRGRHGRHRRRAPRGRQPRASRSPSGSRSRCATWPSSTRAWPCCWSALTLGLVVALHMGDVPERVRRAGRILIAVMVAQAAVGYTQYFTHLPALLVEVHLLGATALVIGADADASSPARTTPPRRCPPRRSPTPRQPGVPDRRPLGSYSSVATARSRPHRLAA